jgi:rhodanese-related sulfurtransferase
MPKNRVRSQQGRSMPSTTTISIDKLGRLIGTPHCPLLVDVRTDEDYKTNPALIPSSTRRPHADASTWAAEFAGRSAVVVCQKGAKVSEGAAAWLRHAGIPADTLEHGFEGWRKAGLPLVNMARMPSPRRPAHGVDGLPHSGQWRAGSDCPTGTRRVLLHLSNSCVPRSGRAARRPPQHLVDN